MGKFAELLESTRLDKETHASAVNIVHKHAVNGKVFRPSHGGHGASVHKSNVENLHSDLVNSGHDHKPNNPHHDGHDSYHKHNTTVVVKKLPKAGDLGTGSSNHSVEVHTNQGQQRYGESVELTIEDKDRSEHSANLHLGGEHDQNHKDNDGKDHYLYVRQRGEKKFVAGPFKSKHEAETHPQRKWVDGVHSQ